MEDFTKGVIIILLISGIGFSFVWGFVALDSWSDEENQKRYFKCLGMTDVETCNKVFYNSKLK